MGMGCYRKHCARQIKGKPFVNQMLEIIEFFVISRGAFLRGCIGYVSMMK